MNEIKRTAYRLKFTAGDPETMTSDTWLKDKSFRCSYRQTSSSESVRAGRDAMNTGKRVYYFTRYISFGDGDRVELDGKEYKILYIPEDSMAQQIAYIDVVAIQ